jgi:hypothetical protein
MKHLIFSSLQFGVLTALFVCLSPWQAWGQCSTQVTHSSGTQLVGCTNVTVTSQGSAGNVTLCGKGPYLIGNLGPGSYTFNFSPAISGVRVGVYAINNDVLGAEEIAFTVNGSFYPVINPGVPDGCLSPAVISPSGTIQACSGCASSWDDIVITETMSSIKVEDVYISGSPSGVVFSLYLCCPSCPTDAGEITANPFNVCVGITGNVLPATQTFLDNNDILQYILFSNPADTLGSILATSNTPSFTFNPATMQTGVTYYIAAIAGNNAGGNVDLNDPCLDISNAIQVTWRPLPTVTFSATNPNVCAGACTTVTANFMGTAPFTLTYTTPAGTAMQTFSGNTGTFQVCTAAGAPPGSFSVEATALMDAFCTCN